jgi:hypothetical protein
MGDRTIEATGSVWFEDVTNNFKAVIIVGTYSKTGFWRKTESGKRDEFVGLIYESLPCENFEASSKILFSKHAEEIKDLKNIKDMVKPICDIKGSWLKDLIIDGEKYWDINEDVPFR